MKPTRIFVDMDGVLCDYYAGVCQVFGYDPWPYFGKPNNWNFWDSFDKHPGLTASDVAPWMGRQFYANLDWLADGGELLIQCALLVGESNVFLLTSPWDTDGCLDGKMDWVKKYIPDYRKRVLIGSCKEACSFPGAVLVDDSDENCKKFDKHGGRSVLVPRPWNSRYRECGMERGQVKYLVGLIEEIEESED